MTAMAIRFQCASCAQPIEIDDEWASKAVACPYCHKTVTAPAKSSLDDPTDVPVAAPVADSPVQPGMSPSISQGPGQPDLRPNWMAILAAASAGAMLVLIVIYLSLVQAHGPEMLDAMNHETDPGKAMEAFRNYVDAQGGFLPSWALSMLAVIAGAGFCWIATGIFGLLGLRGIKHRWLAIAALGLAGLAPPVLCCGGGLFINV